MAVDPPDKLVNEPTPTVGTSNEPLITLAWAEEANPLTAATAQASAGRTEVMELAGKERRKGRIDMSELLDDHLMASKTTPPPNKCKQSTLKSTTRKRSGARSNTMGILRPRVATLSQA
jgi:hypothetical protein